jgi:uncharacterized protein (DUF1684 family)
MQAPEHSRHAARSPDSSAPDTSPEDAAARAVQLFSQRVLQHRLIQRQFRYQLLQSRVLVPQLLNLTNLIYFQASVLRLPPVIDLLRDSYLPDQ